MKIISAVSVFALCSCATSFDNAPNCHQKVSALSAAEVAAQKKSDEAMAASDKDPESSELASAAAQAAIEWIAATAELDDAEKDCVDKMPG